VQLNGNPVQSCQLPIDAVADQRITTIEGMANADGTLSALQQAWIEHDVAQCGYCQAGQIVRASALLARNPNPTDAEIDAGMAPNLCRCGTYNRIRAGIRTAAEKLAKTGGAA
jgi:isoquinoline 1-oxidoreductase alpha subunit